jgi:citrate lyase subunit alpha/citrate CoA-transferase
MLKEGLTKFILDGQSFDLAGVESLRDNWNHIETNPFVSYNYHTKGCFAPRVKASVLGATEVDLDFNVNVNTHSDGWLLHGIGGFQDAADAYMTIITAPLYRKTNPIVVERVHTVTAPGDVIDAIVTDHGIAINPSRTDLMDRLKKTDLPLVSIEELHEKAIGFTGKSEPARTRDNVVAVIEWRDGTIIDAVREIDTE